MICVPPPAAESIKACSPLAAAATTILIAKVGGSSIATSKMVPFAGAPIDTDQWAGNATFIPALILGSTKTAPRKLSSSRERRLSKHGVGYYR